MVDSDVLSRILGDLSNRRAEIKTVNQTLEFDDTEYGSKCHYIEATVPLIELSDYSHTIRTLSSGRADMQLRLEDYKPVSIEEKTRILSKHRFTNLF